MVATHVIPLHFFCCEIVLLLYLLQLHKSSLIYYAHIYMHSEGTQGGFVLL